MHQTLDTLIIGGGISGLSCARRLHECGRSFRLLTDRLGGRIYAPGSPKRNLGATYITSDYRHVRRFVRRGKRIWMRDVFFWDGTRFVTVLHPKNVRRARAISRLYGRLIAFRQRLNRLRAQAPYACQMDLLRKDPELERTVLEPASDFIKRWGLEEIDEIFCGPIVASTVFRRSEEVNTFYYLACLMPILLPTWVADFETTIPALCSGFETKISFGKALAVDRDSHGCFHVTAATGSFRARNVVVATPAHNTRRFCADLDRAAADEVREVPFCSVVVKGRRRSVYRPGKTVFLPPGGAATVLMPLDSGGTDLLFLPSCESDFSEYYEEFRIEHQVRWKTAIIVSGPKWRPLSPETNLYTIGDYNICGLEDSYLTGLYAANQIIGRANPLPQPVKIAPRIHWIPRQVGVKA